MREISAYKIIEQIYEGSSSRVYRALRASDGLPLILKLLNDDYPSPQRLARFINEFEMTPRIEAGNVSEQAPAGIIGAYALETQDRIYAIALEDFGAVSLDHLLPEDGFVPKDFYPLALRIAAALGEVHDRRIIHKDINPSNIVFNPRTGQAKIIDFSASTSLPRQFAEISAAGVIEGTLAYCSPEQTGRMNRAIDYRSDYYSLGVTFFQLLSGGLPFSAADELSLVHCHLASTPPTLSDLVSRVPVELSAVVAKLMAKTPEERYRSTRGLIADLEYCAALPAIRKGSKSARANASVDTAAATNPAAGSANARAFKAGGKDSAGRFQISSKIFGREKELELLGDCLRKTAKGSTEILLVSGYSGVGKSSLIRELHRPALDYRAYFASGKFDQFRRDLPYSAIIASLRELVRHILSEANERIAVWKATILQALGPNSGVAGELVPELRLLTGAWEPVVELPPAEAQNRLQTVVWDFVQCFARVEHPLILFLDDLQWADPSSLTLLESLPALPYLFLIGAYRDNEVQESHPLKISIETIGKKGFEVRTLTLQPLDLSQVRAFLAETFSRAEKDVGTLAGLLFPKTLGNPFFLSHMLTGLVERELVFYEGKQGRWNWKLDAIRDAGLAENAVELMVGKIALLPGHTKDFVVRASCAGNRFDYRLLVAAGVVPKDSAPEALRSAVRSGLVSVAGGYATLALASDDGPVECAFAHDRIQQAAYGMLGERESEGLHLALGRALIAAQRDGGDESKLFEIANHMNLARGLLSRDSERMELARINLRAGKKAKRSAAYATSLLLLQNGLELAGPRVWRDDYKFALELTEEAAEAAYLCGEYEPSERLTEAILSTAPRFLDKIKAYEILVQSHVSRGDIATATKIAVFALARLGLKIPAKPRPYHVSLAFTKARLALRAKNIETVPEIEETKDPRTFGVMRLNAPVASAMYILQPRAYAILECGLVELSLRTGNTPLSPTSYAAFGCILCDRGAIDEGYRFGKAAERMVAKSQNKGQESRVHLKNGLFNFHWKEHLERTLPVLKEGYRTGLQAGDHQYAAFSCMTIVAHSLWTGANLEKLETEAAAYRKIAAQLGQGLAERWIRIFEQGIHNLLGKSASPVLLTGEAMDETTLLPSLRENNDSGGLMRLLQEKQFLYYLFGEYDQAMSCTDNAREYYSYVPGQYLLPLFRFYESLICLALAGRSAASRRSAFLRRVAGNQAWLRRRAQHAPANHLHKWHLVEAGLMALRGKGERAAFHYDEAIRLAKQHAFIHEEAVAWELAGQFYIAKGKTLVAQVYLAEAHYCYRLWGAAAKCAQLEKNYPAFRLASRNQGTPPLPGGSSHAGSRSMEQATLDVAAIMKASRAISREIELEKVLSTLLDIMIESSGAQAGCLVLKKEKSWLALARTADKKLREREYANFETAERELGRFASFGLLRYVLRSAEAFVSDKLSSEALFTGDPYVKTVKPKSAMCVPIRSGVEALGAVYLENSLSDAVFAKDRTEVIDMLAAQGAISIQNALLFEERKEVERLTELDELKTAFFANVTHELRTPLTLLVSPLERALERAGENGGDGGPVSDEVYAGLGGRETISSMYRNALNLMRLVNNLLDHARIDAKKMSVNPVPVHLNKTLAFYAAAFETIAADRGLTLACKMPREAVYTNLDLELFDRVVLNLLSNACKFTPSGGRVELRLSYFVSTLRIEVRDTGIGIAPGDRERIFERFFQVSQSTGGSGLGLALAREIVQLHGGKIWVESDEGRGSVFYVELLRVPAPRQPGSDGSSKGRGQRLADIFAASLPQGRKTEGYREHAVLKNGNAESAAGRAVVLVAEDNRDMLDFLLGTLSEDHAVIAAADGREAFELALRHRPDLIVSDLMMPRLDGLGLIRELRADPATAAIPVILLTARNQEESRIGALESGAEDYISKPFSTRELKARIKNQLELQTLRKRVEVQNAELQRTVDVQLDRLLRSERLATLGTVTAEIAHEINNPTHVIKINASTVQTLVGKLLTIVRELKLEDDDSAYPLSKIRENLPAIVEDIQAASNRIARIVSELKDQARGDPKEWRTVDLRDVVQNALRLNRVLLRRTTEKLEIELGSETVQARVAPLRIEQVIGNLLQNAAQALPESSCGIYVSLGIEKPTREAVLRVRDEGNGIAATDLPHLGEAYFSTKREQGGTGLGLMICRRIAAEHKGSLTVENHPEGGVVATLRIPMNGQTEGHA